MQTLSLVWGLLSLAGMGVAFFPCLGSLNWMNIPFSGVGLFISVIALARNRKEGKGGSIAGVLCCGIAITAGIFRLKAGGGLL